jgi:hypothetical protein
LGELSKQYTSVCNDSSRKVCPGIDRLNGIVQTMRELNQPPTDASKLVVLRNALQIPSLKSLWLAIALYHNPTYYDELTAMCKRYESLEEANFITPEKGKRKHVDSTDCSHIAKNVVMWQKGAFPESRSGKLRN